MSFNIKGHLGGYLYFAFGEYFPKNRYQDIELTKDEVKLRKAIWGFKDGCNAEGNAKVIAKYISKVLNIEILEHALFCVIPASTRAKTKIRYEKFCEIVCEKTGMINGYNKIINNIDHDAGHLFGKADSVLDYIKFGGEFDYKFVILFDDVTTRGKTFIEIADELKKLGAKSIVGIFLGKTTYKQTIIDELNIDDFDIEEIE